MNGKQRLYWKCHNLDELVLIKKERETVIAHVYITSRSLTWDRYSVEVKDYHKGWLNFPVAQYVELPLARQLAEAHGVKFLRDEQDVFQKH